MSKELKAFTVTISLGNPNGELTDKKVCLKDEVDALLAERDATIAELKQKLEDAKASHYAEMVDAGMRERRLRRALWLARAKSAENAVTSWCRECMERWNSAERKCLKKAEEYK